MNLDMLTEHKLAGMFDHTLLKPYANHMDFEKLCFEARQNSFAMVAVNSVHVTQCKKLLEGSQVHVGAAIGFPLGQTSIAVKIFETCQAIADGADEIDYVINMSQLKDGDLVYLEKEMQQIVSVCKEAGVLSKVIFENCYLTKNEIISISEIAARVHPDFVKTSTGFGPRGASVEDLKLMKEIVGPAGIKVKAAGGIRSWDSCKAMLEAGAERIGTSSSLIILEEFRQENEHSL